LTGVQRLQLGRLSEISSYFAVEAGPADPADGWRPAAVLLDEGEGGRLLGEVIDIVGARLGTPRRWIAASILFQGWAARLTSIYAGCLVLGGAAPDLAASRVRYRPPAGGPVDMAVDPLVELDAGRAWRRLLDDHLHPLAEVTTAQFRVGRRILEGDIASSLAGSLATLARTGHGSLTDLISRPWAQPPELAAYGSWTQTGEGPRFVRTTCCGYLKIPGGGRCGDCSLAELWDAGVIPRPLPDLAGRPHDIAGSRRVVQVARRDEQEVGQPVQVYPHRVAHRVAPPGQPGYLTLGATAYSPGKVQVRRWHGAAGNDEVGQLGQLQLQLVDGLFQVDGVVIADAGQRAARAGAVRCHQVAADDEQRGLDVAQQGREPVRDAVGERHADRGVALVDRADRLHPRVVLAQPDTAPDPGLPGVTLARVDLHLQLLS
jgi:hypothetical protein